MADAFLSLPPRDRREILQIAASASGRPIHLLEKDVWVVWALAAVFDSPIGGHLVFKGGTSLSKAYNAIRRFSEDVDLTYDIRALAPDLVGDSKEALPATRSQQQKWTRTIRKLLPDWVARTALPIVEARLALTKAPAKARADGEQIFIAYEPVATGSGYVSREVKLEFGARSTGEPCSEHDIACDAAPSVSRIAFPTARARVMRAERTFWEKATAVHVFCEQGEGPPRFARHWHDLARLDAVGIAAAALADRSLAQAVARHKSMFFVEKDAEKRLIDYDAAVGGGLKLVPAGKGLEALSGDYAAMIADGLLLDEAETFEKLMERCRDLEGRANAIAAR